MASVQVHLTKEQDKKLQILKAIFAVSNKEKVVLKLIDRYKLEHLQAFNKRTYRPPIEER